jgi:hypothetical protein
MFFSTVTVIGPLAKVSVFIMLLNVAQDSEGNLSKDNYKKVN